MKPRQTMSQRYPMANQSKVNKKKKKEVIHIKKKKTEVISFKRSNNKL